MSKLSQLRKENNALEKELTRENSSLITRMYFYLTASALTDLEVETIRKDLTGMALEAQERNDSFAEVIGEDYTLFCNELIANGRKKTPLTKVLDVVELLLYTGIALLIATIFLNGTLPGTAMMVTPAFFVSILFGIVCGTAVMWFLSRVVWGLPGEHVWRNRILGYGGVVVVLAGFLLLYSFLPTTELFTIDPYVVLVIGVVILIGVILIRRRQN
ncbi:hypothetical protein [Methanorbis rubei]|uniref:DUF1129 domain-containing protein n=1 Tax=Methanorbis rubei TaxID=3028300 RepID=A0AAE4SBZ0_9EURY|nr:hypothetical protein [Methanocorpusculaceae archaeon Cs1]